MESISIAEAKAIFGSLFLGIDELKAIHNQLGIQDPSTLDASVPSIPFGKKLLQELSTSHILILGIPFTVEKASLSIMYLRNRFGLDPAVKEPCFYNQDWYVKEQFVHDCTIDIKWYLLSKDLIEDSRGKSLEEYGLVGAPSALLCSYAFFAWYFHSGEYLWKNDFVWCSDTDANGDRIYVGRYFDPAGIAKNGFSIHRHLRLRKHYGSISLM